MNLESLIIEAIELPRDIKREAVIARSLRQATSSVRMALIRKLFDQTSPSSMPIAMSSINSREEAKEIIDHLLPKTDASSMRQLLEFGIKKLGARTLLRMLKEKREVVPRLFDKVIYWLPSLLSPAEMPLLEEFKGQ